MTCNHKWRSYTKRFKKNLLANENEGNPLETYSDLEKNALQKFKERISSKEFQVISEKAKMSSMCNTNPAQVGPCGYRGNKPMWELEKASGELSSRFYEIKSERSLDYVLGRRYKNESGSKPSTLNGSETLGKCAFLNPYKILGKVCQETPIDVVNYLVDVMRLHHGKSFLIAPYLQNTHWVLLVICPSNHIVYILDSLMKPMKNPVDNYYLLKLLEKAFERYEKNTSISIVWKLAECNQDGVLESELSEHYVTNWIFDFVLNGQHGFPNRFGTLWNDKTTFEEKALVTTVATWAREFLKIFMNDVVV
ncbi:unnamed protein product [Lactuca virosa]|uniref:Ubiquitin-like protease family profile domain-containing protein n=1 Tax=Lactuca virosa TaxID=75947 RepID=A0AAU9PWA2_9ASTR|nr:unnamed protein product [Lactuca virosa]